MTRKIAGHKDFNWKESHGNVFEKQREKKKKKKKREREKDHSRGDSIRRLLRS